MFLGIFSSNYAKFDFKFSNVTFLLCFYQLRNSLHKLHGSTYSNRAYISHDIKADELKETHRLSHWSQLK